MVNNEIKYFEYGETELNYLISKDKELSKHIKSIGKIKREIITDTFTAIIYNIIGQQISLKALDKIWNKFKEEIADIKPKAIIKTKNEILNKQGIPIRKIEYIKQISTAIENKELDIEKLKTLSDEEVIKALTKYKGIGKWTAEMILIFNLGRKNIFSENDLMLKEGLKELHKEEITKEIFDKYRNLYSPYCTIASFYLWAIANKKRA